MDVDEARQNRKAAALDLDRIGVIGRPRRADRRDRVPWAVCSFYDERQGDAQLDERDAVERVGRYEYDAGAVSGRTIEALRAEGTLAPDSFRIIWSSPGYSHCCFRAHSEMDPALVEKITQAFVAIDAQDPAGKVVLEGEGCNAFVPGITTGWETLEKAAEQAWIL